MQITLSTIRTAYRSWIETLAEIMTTTFNRKKHWRVMAYKTNDGYEIYERKSGKTKILGTFAKTSDDSDIKKLKKKLKRLEAEDASQSCLRLSQSNVLQKNIKLPGGALDVLEPVIKNQMRRLVPWPEEETCFSYFINKENSTTSELDITIIAASKAVIASSVEDLSTLNIKIGSADYADAPDSNSSMELLVLSNEAKQKYINSIQRYIALYAMLMIAISGLGLSKLFVGIQDNQRSTRLLESARNTFAVLRKRNAENLKRTQDKSLLIIKKKQSLPVLLLLENVSKSLPDKAWLQKLEVDGSNMTIDGHAAYTPELVKALEASPVLTNVRFSAPTTRVGIANLETFSIMANVLKAEKAQ